MGLPHVPGAALPDGCAAVRNPALLLWEHESGGRDAVACAGVADVRAVYRRLPGDLRAGLAIPRDLLLPGGFLRNVAPADASLRSDHARGFLGPIPGPA